jgi:anaerobic nitric oxide reductase transcription regulator
VNCAALPETVAESELFGHVRGAFTGATHTAPASSRWPTAARCSSTRSASCCLTVQPKLLRALQQGEIQRVGADRPILVDVRVIAATNRDLEREVAAGRFRADLFHRLAVYPHPRARAARA